MVERDGARFPLRGRRRAAGHRPGRPHRAVRVTPVFDGLTPSEAAERISRFGIEIGDNNGHVVGPSLANADTAAAIALAHATGEVRAARRSVRPPIVRLVTYDDTAAHRADAVLNLDWRHRFTGPTLDSGWEHRLRDALAGTTAAMKATYRATEITLAVKADLPIAVALGHAFAEPTGCTIRMARDDLTYTVGRAGTDATPLRGTPYSTGPIESRAAAVEVAVTRDTEAGVNAYSGAGNRYRERILLVPPDGPGRFSLDGSETCNAWARQTARSLPASPLAPTSTGSTCFSPARRARRRHRLVGQRHRAGTAPELDRQDWPLRADVAPPLTSGGTPTKNSTRYAHEWNSCLIHEPCGDDVLDAIFITTGGHVYRRPDGIGVVPAALLGP